MMQAAQPLAGAAAVGGVFDGSPGQQRDQHGRQHGGAVGIDGRVDEERFDVCLGFVDDAGLQCAGRPVARLGDDGGVGTGLRGWQRGPEDDREDESEHRHEHEAGGTGDGGVTAEASPERGPGTLLTAALVRGGTVNASPKAKTRTPGSTPVQSVVESHQIRLIWSYQR